MYEYNVVDVVKFVDGDTLDVIIDLGFHITRKERIRLADIDVPELNSSNEAERKISSDAKLFVMNWILKQKNLKIKTIKDDKYGRLVGIIYGNNNECLNDILIEEGYAWKYQDKNTVRDVNILLEKRKEK
jgi:micrococcal nuclease